MEFGGFEFLELGFEDRQDEGSFVAFKNKIEVFNRQYI